MEKENLVLCRTVVHIGLHCFLDPELYPKNCDLECKYYVQVLFFKKPNIVKAICQFRRIFIFLAHNVLFI